MAAVGVARDATTEQRANTERAYQTSLVDNIDDAVVGTHADFCLTVWNRGAERLYGFSADEVLGLPAREVVSYAGDQSPRALPAGRRGRARVLLVGDHAIVREAIAAMFAREGDFDVVGQAASLAEARSMLWMSTSRWSIWRSPTGSEVTSSEICAR